MSPIIASIIGCTGSIPGAMLGGFFLGIVENLGIWKIQAGWKDSITFAVLIVFLLFRPGGNIWREGGAGEGVGHDADPFQWAHCGVF